MSSSDPVNTCQARTLSGAVHGAAFGLFFSLINSGNDVAVWMEGSNNPTASGLLSMVGSRVGRNVGVFGIGTGLYNGLRCSMEMARGRRDWINGAFRTTVVLRSICLAPPS
jgi:hypothetical protein